jgi:glycopeptide antibiotics resistance protein
MDEITFISLIVLGIALLLPVLSEKLAKNDHLFKQVKYLIFATYIIANLFETLLFRAITPNAKYELGFLWSYREALSVHHSNGLSISITNFALLKENILNILLYIPFGYLLPFTWPTLAERKNMVHSKNGRLRWLSLISWKVVLIGFFCSGVTEVTQLVFHLGLFEFDDILNNTVGNVIGVTIYYGLLKGHAKMNHESVNT